MLCALIMAGGKGTRFWPLSTEKMPKQFLELVGDRTMIQMTVDRISEIIPIDRIFICTSGEYVNIIKSQLPEIEEENIIVEPISMNTAPCIALSSLIIQRRYKNINMVVLPADHIIRNQKRFTEIIRTADMYLEGNKEAVITLGMKAVRPDTGYGYIEAQKEYTVMNDMRIMQVKKFTEKPDLKLAESYVMDGKHYWNGGIFIWSIYAILNNIKRCLPNTYEALKNIASVNEIYLQNEINNNYQKVDKISIDYGVLEKIDELYVIPSEIGWDDIGSWEALKRYRDKDNNGNIIIGNVSSVNSKNNIIIANNIQIILDDIDELFVIENEGKVVIGKKDNLNRVKELKQII